MRTLPLLALCGLVFALGVDAASSDDLLQHAISQVYEAIKDVKITKEQIQKIENTGESDTMIASLEKARKFCEATCTSDKKHKMCSKKIESCNEKAQACVAAEDLCLLFLETTNDAKAKETCAETSMKCYEYVKKDLAKSII